MDLEAAEVDARRLELAGKYAAEWDAVLVLKGAPTVIGCPDGNVYINTTGNSAMATGGSGDVLTGIIAGLAAQGISVQEAALAGVYMHGLAGDLASKGLLVWQQEKSASTCHRPAELLSRENKRFHLNFADKS